MFSSLTLHWPTTWNRTTCLWCPILAWSGPSCLLTDCLDEVGHTFIGIGVCIKKLIDITSQAKWSILNGCAMGQRVHKLTVHTLQISPVADCVNFLLLSSSDQCTILLANPSEQALSVDPPLSIALRLDAMPQVHVPRKEWRHLRWEGMTVTWSYRRSGNQTRKQSSTSRQSLSDWPGEI